jgi:hypothetical protein
MRDHPSAQLWNDPGAYAFPLLVLVLDEFGTECLQWDPGTVAMEIEQSFGVRPPPLNLDRTLAAMVLLSTDSFFNSVTDFCQLTLALCGKPRAFLPDAVDCAWGLTEGLLIFPPEADEENPFDPEIVALLGKILQTEGILNPPDVLRIATHDSGALDRARYDWSDDENMTQMMTEFAQSKTEEINNTLNDRLLDMLTQLQHLPLTAGRADQVAQRLINRLQQTRNSSSLLPVPGQTQL